MWFTHQYLVLLAGSTDGTKDLITAMRPLSNKINTKSINRPRLVSYLNNYCPNINTVYTSWNIIAIIKFLSIKKFYSIHGFKVVFSDGHACSMEFTSELPGDELVPLFNPNLCPVFALLRPVSLSLSISHPLGSAHPVSMLWSCAPGLGSQL